MSYSAWLVIVDWCVVVGNGVVVDFKLAEYCQPGMRQEA